VLPEINAGHTALGKQGGLDIDIQAYKCNYTIPVGVILPVTEMIEQQTESCEKQ
jgi:hypothetical protein